MQTNKQQPVTMETSPETIQQALAEAKNLLSLVTDQPALEAEILLAHVLDAPRSYVHAFASTLLKPEQVKAFTDCLLRRREGQPIAYITGSREFWSLSFSVTRDTLIPRPESELLVEAILESHGENKSAVRMADLGTGCGAIALALAHEKPDWEIHATDVCEAALQVARNNASRFSMANVSFHHGNWCQALPGEAFDIIVSNPPYIAETEWEAYAQGLAFEPRDALVSGLDGLDAIRTITHSARTYLKDAGLLAVEHGFLQGAAVRKIFAASGYSQIHSLRDLSGQERVTVGRCL